MKAAFDCLYQEMLKDLQRCMQLPQPEKENAESCFWIAKNYGEQLKEAIRKKGFASKEEEIEFFRDVKPEFTSHIEYFVLLTEALQFEPKPIPVPERIAEHVSDERWKGATDKAIREYWEGEEKRFKRFCSKHAAFIEYYESGERCKDEVYFLRDFDLPKEVKSLPSYDSDSTYSIYHEQLLRSYLANKRYYDFVIQKLAGFVKD